MIEKQRLQSYLTILIAGLQIFDMVIHAATNQLEPLRVISNLVILGWLALAGRIQNHARLAARTAAGLYLALNLIFLARFGIRTAPDGPLRVILFGLVLLTCLLSEFLGYLLSQKFRE